MVNELLKRAMNAYGLKEGILINSVPIRQRYFRPHSIIKEITDKPINGDNSTDITVFQKTRLLEYELSGSFTSVLGDPETLYWELFKMIDKGDKIQLAGTDFDDRTFLGSSLTMTKKGINFVDFTLLLKEIKLVSIKKFQISENARIQAKHGKTNKSGKINKSTKIIQPTDY